MEAAQLRRTANSALLRDSDWEEIEAPWLTDATRAFRRVSPPFSQFYLVVQHGSFLGSVGLRGPVGSLTTEHLLAYAEIVYPRLEQAAGASAVMTPIDARLVASLLTDRDVPADLRLYSALSGPLSLPGLRGYLEVFARRDLQDLESLQALPSGVVASTTSAVLMPTVDTGQDMLDRLASVGQWGLGPRANLRPWSAPSVGEESRAFTYTMPIGDLVTASPAPRGGRAALLGRRPAADVVTGAVIIFRRGSVYPMVEVRAVGTEPQMDDAIRLAEVLDGRVQVAGAPGLGPSLAASAALPVGASDRAPQFPNVAAAPPTRLPPVALPSARELASAMSAALDRVQTARLMGRLPNGHRSAIVYVAPDRASYVQWDERNREVQRAVRVGEVTYAQQFIPLWTPCRRSSNPLSRAQAEIFRPMQVALATGTAQYLADEDQVEVVEIDGRLALRAIFRYDLSPELEELGLQRSGTSVLEVVVDPDTWLPFHTREEADGQVTEVTFVAFNEPITLDIPPRC